MYVDSTCKDAFWNALHPCHREVAGEGTVIVEGIARERGGGINSDTKGSMSRGKLSNRKAK